MSLTQKSLTLLLSPAFVANYIYLIIGYFFGPYYGFMRTSEDVLATCAIVLTSPFVFDAIKYSVRKVKSLTSDLFATTLTYASAASAALFILIGRANLLPSVVTQSISSLLKSAGTLSGTWLDSASTTLKYTLNLFGIDLLAKHIEPIKNFIQSFVNFDIMDNLSGVLYTTSTQAAPYTLGLWSRTKQEPRTIFLAVIYAWGTVKGTWTTASSAAFTAAYDSYFAIANRTGIDPVTAIQNVWKDAAVPYAIKILAAAKAWLVYASAAVLDILNKFFSPCTSQTIAFSIGLTCASMGAAWLTKKIYVASADSLGVTTPIPSNIVSKLQAFGVTCQFCIGMTNSMFVLLLNPESQKAEWTKMKVLVTETIENIKNQDDYNMSEFPKKIINLIEKIKMGEEKTRDTEAKLLGSMIDFLKNLIKNIKNENENLVTVNVSYAEKVQGLAVTAIAEFNFYLESFTLKRDGKKVKYKEREIIDFGLLNMIRAVENAEYKI